MAAATASERAAMPLILHVIEDLYAESGGPPAVVLALACEQARAGRSVAVVVSHGPRDADERTRITGRFAAAGVGFVDLSEEGPPSRRALDSCVAWLRPSVVHLHGMWGASVRHGAAIARARGIPYVLSTHGMLHPYALAQRRWKKRIYLALFPRVIGDAAEILALNREEADFVAARFRVRSSVLPNGILAAEYSMNDPAPFLAEHAGLAGAPFVLFVGRVHPIKGIDGLVRSFALARARGLPHELVIIGPEDGGGDDARRAAREGGVLGHVHFVGAVFGDLKRSALAACDVVAHRPRFEGFGLAVVEALASGKPVVTTERCLLDGAAEAGAILRAADTDEGFAEALLAAASDRARSAEVAARGQRWARSEFDWPNVVARLDGIYGRVVGG